MQLSITHTSEYAYAEPADYGLLRIRLKPKPTHGQEIVRWSMELEGAKVETEYEDQHNNAVVLASVDPGTTKVRIICRGTVNTSDKAGVIGQHAGHMPVWAFEKQTERTQPNAQIRQLAASMKSDPTNLLDTLHELSARILELVAYETGTTDSGTTAAEAMAAGKGVCQDHSHIFISAARHLGVPARYVSGYLMMDDRIEQEASHAWAEAYLAHIGWVGFDISNGISPDERYVRVATGCDYRDAAPIIGIAQGTGDSALNVRLSVEQHSAAQ
jgi:transglutaminase-like putative cysteine protease